MYLEQETGGDIMALWIIWIIAGVLLLIGEIFTPGFLLASFGLACFASGLVAALSFGLKAQVIIFSVITLVVFFGIRPVILKYFHRSGSGLKTNVDALVGKKGVVIDLIDPAFNTGRVIVDGENWRGISVDDETIEKDARILVIRVEGTKLFVKPVGAGDRK